MRVNRVLNFYHKIIYLKTIESLFIIQFYIMVHTKLGNTEFVVEDKLISLVINQTTKTLTERQIQIYF
jgi:hypothetical protein